MSETNNPQNHDASATLQAQIEAALANHGTLNIRAGDSKDFLGCSSTSATPLDVSEHRGIISYEPTELVITARAGTPLTELNQVLAKAGQWLPFEPPAYTNNATLGGTVACAMSGPARPFAGAVRDYVLGCRIINGHGQDLQFGGQVMKNVAGYDVTRLMTGARGTLGLLLDISVKVLPNAAEHLTLEQNLTATNALTQMSKLMASGHPVSAASYVAGVMHTRLSGSSAELAISAKALGGSQQVNSQHWTNLRDHKLNFFTDDRPLWRLSLPPGSPNLSLAGDQIIDWAGQQRWLLSDQPAEQIRAAASTNGGYAQLFRAPPALQKSAGVEHPLTDKIMQLHKNLKQAFDPHGLFNRCRLYNDL